MTNRPHRPVADSRIARAAGAALLLLATGIASADDAPSAAAAVQPAAPLDVAARWREFFATVDTNALSETFGLISELDAGHGDVDAAACEKHAAEIERALTVNTVGLAMWYSAYQCALALHQPEIAERRFATFGALTRYAVAGHRTGILDSPIHVLSELDIWAFARASGEEVLYAYYDAPRLGRELPFTVALWDAEHKREHVLRFDYLDARARASQNRELAELPAFRFHLARGFLTAFGKNPASYAAAALELQNAAADPAKRIAALEDKARNGSFAAAIGHAFLCIVPARSTCADASVDLLLPWAEKSYAMSLVLLAVAYDEGRGVRRSEDNAAKLLKKADERLGDGRGSILFQSFAALSNPDQARLHPLVRKTIENLAAQGAPLPEWIVALSEMQQNKGEPSKQTLAHLRHAAEAGLADAQQSLGLYLRKHGAREDGLHWLEKAAAADQRASQIVLARAYETGDGVDKDVAKARDWYAAAGMSGEPSAMLWMASYYAGQPTSDRARKLQEGWLESAMYTGSVEAALALARMYESDGGDKGFGSPAGAMEIYRSLDKRQDNAEARRRLAALLAFSDKIEHDLAGARELLQRDADRGDATSQVMLAWMQASGTWGDGQKQAGLDALRKLGDGGNVEALVELGQALYYADEPRRREGIQAWQRAADKGNTTAINNMAWALCTSPDAALLDGPRGLELAHKVADADDAPFGYRDTLAACYARSGDFDQAERVEQAALARIEDRAPAAAVARAKERIADYHAHKPYVEVQAKK